MCQRGCIQVQKMLMQQGLIDLKQNQTKRVWQFIILYISNTILYHKQYNTMRPNIRQKSRSLPILRCRIYQKIGARFLHQKWRQFLNKQLQLQWPIRQLSKTQFDVNNHSHQKFSVRQNLIMKKDIIKCLERAEISIATHKLEQLKNKMIVINQQKGAEMMIIYLDCRRKILQDLKVGGQEQVIQFIREKLARFLGDADLCMMKIKCMTIICILMLRFHGILMTTDERNIIFKTIQIKKKKFLYLDLQQQRQSQFESLLYLLEEIFKLLFLLKKDQHLILNYYNQLHAYTEIYLQNHRDKRSNIDIFQINKTLKHMKPIMSDLNIYQDCKLRKQLAVAHIKDEIVEKKQRQFSRQSIDFKNRIGSIQNSSNSKMGSSQKMASISKLKLLRLDGDGEKKNPNISIISEESVHQIMNELSLKGIKFDCLLPIKEKIYIVKTNIGFRNGFSLVDLTLTIEIQNLSCEIYRLRGIEMCLLVLNIDGIAKFIEKMFSKLFGIANFFQLHNLITVNLQNDLYLEELVPVMVRCKAILKEYFRRNYYQEPINGSKFIYPKISLVDLKKEIENLITELAIKMQNVNFVKRKGMISKDQEFSLKQNYVDLKGIIVKRMDQYSHYVLFNAHFKLKFKGLDFFHFQDGAQLEQLPLYIKQLKKISQKGIKSHQSGIIAKCINQIISVHVEQEKISNSCKQYKLQQQLQINQKKLNCQTISILGSSKFKRKTKKPTQNSFQIFRTNKLQYVLFRKHIDEGYVIYKNQKNKICVSNTLNCNYKLIKKRLRMYNSIKLVLDKNNDRFLTVLRGQNLQTFVLTFLRHYVLRKKRGFFMILIYQCPKNEYLYEIIDKFQRFFFTSQEYLSKQLLSQTNIQDGKVGNYQLKTFEQQRTQLSEANRYYLKTMNMKVLTRLSSTELS